MKRSTPLRRTPMTARKTARLAEAGRRVQETRAIVWARDEGMCAVCGGRASDLHHRRPRGMGGASRNLFINSPANTVALCREHHTMIESNREWAQMCGLLLTHNHTDPSEVVMLYRGDCWVFLTDDGHILAFEETA